MFLDDGWSLDCELPDIFWLMIFDGNDRYGF